MITIGIPAYNVEKYITRCLLSVENQTYNNIEVIIVEDCSTDSTLLEVENFLKTQNHTKTYKLIKNLNNKGLAFNRNRIIEESKGEYIFFLDSDDEIPMNSIELLFNKINNSKYDFVCGGIQYIANNDSYNEFFQNYSSQYQNYAFANFFINNKFKYHNEVWNKLYRKSFLLNNDLKFIDVKSHEDSIFTFQVMVNCKSFGMIAEPVYKYYQYSKSMSHDINSKQYIDFIKEVI